MSNLSNAVLFYDFCFPFLRTGRVLPISGELPLCGYFDLSNFGDVIPTDDVLLPGTGHLSRAGLNDAKARVAKADNLIRGKIKGASHEPIGPFLYLQNQNVISATFSVWSPIQITTSAQRSTAIVHRRNLSIIR